MQKQRKRHIVVQSYIDPDTKNVIYVPRIVID